MPDVQPLTADDQVDLEAIAGELVPQQVAPIPHDGWHSRKLIAGGVTLVLFVGLSFSMMFVESPLSGEPLATSLQVFSFWAILVPSVVIPVMGSLGIDKLAEARRVR